MRARVASFLGLFLLTPIVALASNPASATIAHVAGQAPCRSETSAAAMTSCPLAITVHVTQANMPNLAASEQRLSVGCLSGTTLVGGGILQDKVDGTQPNNGLRIHGTLPAGKHNPSRWTALGGFGGQSEPGDQVRVFSVCAAGGPAGIQNTTVVTKTANGPKAAATDTKVTVTCPTATRMIGGGAATAPASEPSLKPIGSFPSTARGAPLTAGAGDSASWTAVGAAGGMQFGTGHPTTTVYAICAKTTALKTVVGRADLIDHPAGPGNLNPGSDPFAIATAACPAATTLLGGGVLADGNAKGPDGHVPQQGVHVRGSYPSSVKGLPLGESATQPRAWTVIVQSGGQATLGTDTHAFALCAS
jgi:hypothetical protein